MSVVTRPRFVDVGNPALAIVCPRCGLRTARFLEFCNNCGYALWPSVVAVSRAFKIWKAHDPARELARPFDVEMPQPPDSAPVIDFEARAHHLGIHLFPGTKWAFPICAGLFFLMLAVIPFTTPVRIGLGVFGAILFLVGIGGWVVVEDVKMYEAQDPAAAGEAHH